MTQSILLATDLSANAAFAARWSYNYAKATGAKVILAHIIEINVPNWLRDAYDVIEDDEARAKLEARITAWYHTHTKGEPDGILLAAGNIDQKLAELGEQIDASMIVLAKSGKSMLTRFLAGSTAQMMSANPPRPVVVVHPDHTAISKTTRIAVATDLTPTADKAITAAAKFSGKLKAHLDVVYANAVASPTLEDSSLPEQLKGSTLAARAREQFDRVLAAHADELEGIDTDAHTINASPVEGVTTFAEENQVDIVFVGNAAQYNVITNVFGRVSVKLMQTLPCTVIIVPPDPI